jgi:type IV secretion system protein VirB10
LEPTVTTGVSASMMPDRRFMLSKTKNMDCVLNEALDSTVPGLISCTLTHDVWSQNAEVLLMERGTEVDGEYQSTIKQGQIRLGLLWTRAKTPKGVQINLNSLGTDALGRSGVSGFVDNHFWERFGAAMMTSLISTSVSSAASSKSASVDTVVYGPAVSDGSKIVEKILDSTVNIPPTFVKNQGSHIQIKIARDLDFSSVYGLKVLK